jgi:hypothetical protein
MATVEHSTRQETALPTVIRSGVLSAAYATRLSSIGPVDCPDVAGQCLTSAVSNHLETI